MGYGLVWVRLGLGGFGSATDKTHPIRVNGSVRRAISHANGPNFPPPWSGDIPADAKLPRGVTQREKTRKWCSVPTHGVTRLVTPIGEHVPLGQNNFDGEGTEADIHG
jgi:hypothetical protein